MAVPRTSASDEPKRWPLLVLVGGGAVGEGVRVLLVDEVLVVKAVSLVSNCSHRLKLKLDLLVVVLWVAEEVVDLLAVEVEVWDSVSVSVSVSVWVLLAAELVEVLLALAEEVMLAETAVPLYSKLSLKLGLSPLSSLMRKA